MKYKVPSVFAQIERTSNKMICVKRYRAVASPVVKIDAKSEIGTIRGQGARAQEKACTELHVVTRLVGF